MHITRLDIAHLRRFDRVELAPDPGINVLVGGNGAGKTSVLEALHLMAYGRSFRGRVRDGLVAHGAEAIEIYLEWKQRGATDAQVQRRAGLRHGGQAWTGRLDGAPVDNLGELCAALAVVTFEPGSHVLVSGSREPRRRQLDWGLFHVEPAFLAEWRRYARALKQRNALLKARGNTSQLPAWDRELAEAGDAITRYRQAYVERLDPHFETLVAKLLPEAGAAGLRFDPGWRRDDLSLEDALLLARERDLATGYTSVGPHRADWQVEYGALPGRDQLSRGQAKLTALAFLLGQASTHAAATGEWPVVCLDDLGSELDRAHLGHVLSFLNATPAQVFITGTETPRELAELGLPAQRFSVDEGHVEPMT